MIIWNESFCLLIIQILSKFEYHKFYWTNSFWILPRHWFELTTQTDYKAYWAKQIQGTTDFSHTHTKCQKM